MNHASLLALSFVSGAAALTYETVWLRWFRLLFGSTSYAASATLFAFFTGLAIGAALFGRISESTRRNPIVLYGWVEIGAAAGALLVPVAMKLYDPLYAMLYEHLFDRRELFVAIKFALALFAMLVPTVLLGGTLPLLVATASRLHRSTGRTTGFLYTVNTLGAASGTAMAALWLPEHLGIRATYGIALGLSVAVGASAFALAKKLDPVRPESRPEGRPQSRPESGPATGHGVPEAAAPARLLVIAFGSGFATLAVEVLLIHSMALLNLHSVYSFGAILIVVLLCLAAAAGVASIVGRRIRPSTVLTAALSVTALLLFVLPWTSFVLRDAFGWTSANPNLGGAFLRALVTAGPVIFVGGLVFPTTFRLASGGMTGRRVGGLLAANTFGGILGSACASFVLLNLFGLWGSLAVMGMLYAAGVVLLAHDLRGASLRAGALTATGVAIALAGANPWLIPEVEPKTGQKVLAVRQNADGLIAVVEHDSGYRQIFQNGIYAFGNSARQLYAERAGHLPLLLHPNPRRTLFIGTASGATAGAAVMHPVDEIDLVELVPAVQELAKEFFHETNREVHSDPRTRGVVEDGRNHVRASPSLYDVIVADQFVPWRSGVGSIYSREHFRAVREHLSENGVFCQWLPMFQLGEREFRIVAATFLEVFPNAVLWRSDFYAHVPKVALIGFAGRPPSTSDVERRARSLSGLGVRDPWVTDPLRLWSLHVGPLARIESDLAGTPLNTDDRPVFEFSAGRSTARSHALFARNAWPRLAKRISDGDGSIVAETFPDPTGPGPSAGVLLTRVVALELAGQSDEAARARARAAGQIPPELIRLGPTVSDVRRRPPSGRVPGKSD